MKSADRPDNVVSLDEHRRRVNAALQITPEQVAAIKARLKQLADGYDQSGDQMAAHLARTLDRAIDPGDSDG